MDLAAGSLTPVPFRANAAACMGELQFPGAEGLITEDTIQVLFKPFLKARTGEPGPENPEIERAERQSQPQWSI